MVKTNKRGSGYIVRRQQTFEKLKTKDNEWSAAKIQSFHGKLNFTETGYLWVPNFEIPTGYTHCKTDYSFETDGQCEACSHDIFHFYCIKNDVQKIYMFVGSTCITFFDVKEWVKEEFNSWAKANLPQEWKEVFIPGMDIIREMFKKHNIWMPSELITDGNYARFLKSRKSPKRMATAFEEYGWYLDIIDEVDENSTREEIVEAYYKFAPKTKLFKSMYAKRFLQKRKVVIATGK